MTDRQDDVLGGLRKPSATLDTLAAITDLERYWNELRGPRRLPKRRDVDPGQIGAALPWAFLIQRVAPGVGRIRVAGQRLSELLGMEARGMPLTAYFSAEGRTVITEHVTRLFEDPAIVELPIVSRRGLGRPKMTGRLIILPLIGDDGLVSAALGAMIVDGTIGTTPRRFEIAEGRQRCEPVTSSRIAALHQQILDEAEPTPGPGRAEIPALPGRLPAERSYLRLVIDNG